MKTESIFMLKISCVFLFLCILRSYLLPVNIWGWLTVGYVNAKEVFVVYSTSISSIPAALE